MIMVAASGVPLAVHTWSARPAEVKFVQDTLDASFGLDFPERLIGDKAYDNDGPDADLGVLGIEMIAPNRRNRRRTQRSLTGRQELSHSERRNRMPPLVQALIASPYPAPALLPRRGWRLPVC
ncbi:MAG: transposase [Deinococcus sp.]|nr:transposase [Deinococcus sp.]